MTVVAGAVGGGVVVIGADRLVSGDDEPRAWRSCKLLSLRVPVGVKSANGTPGEAVFASVGSWAIGQLATRRLEVPVAPAVPRNELDAHRSSYAEELDRWAFDLAERLDELAVGRGLTVEDNDKLADVSALLAYGGALWVVGTSSACRVERFDAIGSGGPVAVGAMHVVEAAGGDPEEQVRAALVAACEHASGCGGGTDVRVLGRPAVVPAPASRAR